MFIENSLGDIDLETNLHTFATTSFNPWGYIMDTDNHKYKFILFTYNKILEEEVHGCYSILMSGMFFFFYMEVI